MSPLIAWVWRVTIAALLAVSAPSLRAGETISPTAAHEGWTWAGQELGWIRPGEGWRSFVPPELSGAAVLSAVHRQDGLSWLVAAEAPAVASAVRRDALLLARTTDAGGTWQVAPLILPAERADEAPVSGAYLQFLDAETGWLALRLANGSNFSAGLLYSTSDGGVSWRQRSLPIGAPVSFLTPQIGWTAGGAAGDELYRTDDGGVTWQRQVLSLQPVGRQLHYQLPRFADPQEGWLPVVVSSRSDSWVELYRSRDAGRGWALAWSTAVGLPAQDGSPILLAPLGAGQVAVRAPGADHITIIADGVARDGGDHPLLEWAVGLQMATPDLGWATYRRGACTPDRPAGSALGQGTAGDLTCEFVAGILQTTDGGRSWEELAAPEAGLPRITRRVVAGGSLPEPTRAAGVHTEIFSGHGFDKCEVARPEALLDWIASSPYRAMNLYIGGRGRACSNAALNAGLVTQLAGYGWKFIPTWVGPQAPCYPHDKPRMSSDPMAAYAEGVAEAEAAAERSAALGLAHADGSGAIVYYDMERYDLNDAACHQAVLSFLAGWTAQMHARRNLAGVYGNGPTLTALAGMPDRPDVIWAANWVSPAYDPDASIWGVLGLPDDVWGDHQRIRQYTGGHLETWGSTSLMIDCDVADGVVSGIAAAPAPFRSYLPAVPTGS